MRTLPHCFGGASRRARCARSALQQRKTHAATSMLRSPRRGVAHDSPQYDAHPRVRLMRLFAVALAFALAASGAAAFDFKPYGRGAFAQLTKAHAGRPLIVHFWSLTCPPCLVELPQWAKFAAEKEIQQGLDLLRERGDRERARGRRALDRSSCGRRDRDPSRPEGREVDSCARPAPSGRPSRNPCPTASSSGPPATSAATRCARSSTTPSSSSPACTSRARPRTAGTPASSAAARRPACARRATPRRCSRCDADCVVYTATADRRPFDAVKDIARILASGKNVVSSSIVGLVHPRAPRRARDRRSSRKPAARARPLLHLRHRPGLRERPAPARALGPVRHLGGDPHPGDHQLRDLRAARGALRHDGLRPAARRQADDPDAGRAELRVGRHDQAPRRRASVSTLDDIREVHERRPADEAPRHPGPRRRARARWRPCASRCGAWSAASRCSSSST